MLARCFWQLVLNSHGIVRAGLDIRFQKFVQGWCWLGPDGGLVRLVNKRDD